MSILKRVRKLDWVALTVEVALIFIGITAALWFENQRDARRDGQLEGELLVELRRALVSDTADLNSNQVSNEGSIAAIDSVLAYLLGGRAYDPNMASDFRRATLFTGFIHNAGAYEYVKSVGFDVLSSDALRSELVRYYEYDVPYLEAVESQFVQSNYEQALKPQMLEKFSYAFLLAGGSTPRDYEALATDGTFQSTLTTTREILRWKGTRTDAVLASAEGLLATVEAQLAAR